MLIAHARFLEDCYLKKRKSRKRRKNKTKEATKKKKKKKKVHIFKTTIQLSYLIIWQPVASPAKLGYLCDITPNP